MKKNQFNHLPECQYHFRPLELLCTSTECSKNRLGCARCFYDKIHKECRFHTIFLEDLSQLTINESLEGWLKDENHRIQVEKINETYPKNIMDHFEGISKIIDKKFEEIRENLFKKLENIKKEIIQTIRKKIIENETYIQFKEHFSISTLLEILKNEDFEEMNIKLKNFFNLKAESFLDKWKNEKELIYFTQDKYLNFLDKRTSLQKKWLQSLENDFFSENKVKVFFIPETNLKELNRFKKIVNAWGYTGDKYDSISFKVNKNILLQGVGIFRPSKKNEKIKVMIDINDGESMSEKTVYKGEFEIIGDENSFIEKIECENIMISKEKIYSICLMIDGGDSFNGIEGEEIIKMDDTMFRFFETKIQGENKSNNTGILRGQIPMLYYTNL